MIQARPQREQSDCQSRTRGPESLKSDQNPYNSALPKSTPKHRELSEAIGDQQMLRLVIYGQWVPELCPFRLSLRADATIPDQSSQAQGAASDHSLR